MKLENWYVCGKSICGDVYGNPLFEDGTFVRTSAVQSVNMTYVNTLNSTYELGFSTTASEWNSLSQFKQVGEYAWHQGSIKTGEQE
jgi:hypothetical protein